MTLNSRLLVLAPLFHLLLATFICCSDQSPCIADQRDLVWPSRPETLSLTALYSLLVTCCTFTAAIQVEAEGCGTDLPSAQFVRGTFTPRLKLCRIFSKVASWITASEKAVQYCFIIFRSSNRCHLKMLAVFLQVNDSKIYER